MVDSFFDGACSSSRPVPQNEDLPFVTMEIRRTELALTIRPVEIAAGCKLLELDRKHPFEYLEIAYSC
jgi:hypothetical protein